MNNWIATETAALAFTSLAVGLRVCFTPAIAALERVVVWRGGRAWLGRGRIDIIHIIGYDALELFCPDMTSYASLSVSPETRKTV